MLIEILLSAPQYYWNRDALATVQLQYDAQKKMSFPRQRESRFLSNPDSRFHGNDSGTIAVEVS